MKFVLPRKEFAAAVAAAAAATSTRTSLQFLQNLLLEAGDGVRIVGCDGELFVERRVGATVHETGEVLLPAKTLSEILNGLREGDVTVRTFEDGRSAMVEQGESQYRLQTMETDDFPPVPRVGSESRLTLPAGLLKKAVKSVSYAVSTDDHRAVLKGVLFTYGSDTLTLVATDTHRLAVRRIHQEGVGDATNAIVPEKALRQIDAMPFGEDEPVTLLFGDGKVGVETAGARVVCVLLSGVYPNWERVVPTTHDRVWSVVADQLAETVKRVMILARDNAFRVRFRGSEQTLVLTALSDERGEAKEVVEMVAENGDVEIAFNGKYVQDVLGVIEDPGVRVEMTEPGRPALFRPADDPESYFCVIMPMALG